MPHDYIIKGIIADIEPLDRTKAKVVTPTATNVNKTLSKALKDATKKRKKQANHTAKYSAANKGRLQTKPSSSNSIQHSKGKNKKKA
jgi:hypothetical protein